MQSILTAGLGTETLTKDALKNFGKSLGGKLLKGGIYGAIAGYVSQTRLLTMLIKSLI